MGIRIPLKDVFSLPPLVRSPTNKENHGTVGGEQTANKMHAETGTVSSANLHRQSIRCGCFPIPIPISTCRPALVALNDAAALTAGYLTATVFMWEVARLR